MADNEKENLDSEIANEKKTVEIDKDNSKKELEKIKEKLEDFKKQATKKFPFISSIGLIPPQASKIIEEEEEIGESDTKDKLIHVFVILPDDKAKEAGKVKSECIKIVQSMKPRIWINVKTTSELWEICFDGKYEYVDAISMSFPIFDKGILGALRVASIHKTLVLRKFERYIVSYVIAGSLVRGGAIKTSDVDIYVVIDDTDVKRMSRIELKEKLRAIIYSYVAEASELAGVKNKLSPQVYILTEFWEAVKDAHPVIFTFIRDGIPLYDRGAFTPWKLLLRMGKIKPSPEAIDMFMSLGERVTDSVKRKLNDIVSEDIYWGVITPSQAVLMLYGIAPPTPRETVELMNNIFVEKEKMLEKKYVDILARVVEVYKGFEHESIKQISGKEIDELLQDSADYIKRLKVLMSQIEVRTREKTIVQIYDEVFLLLERIFGKSTEQKLLDRVDKELVKKGKLTQRTIIILREIVKAKQDYKKKKLTKLEVESARKDGSEVTNMLIEYAQRCEIAEIDRTRLRIRYKIGGKEKELDAFLLEKGLYIMFPDAIKKVKEDGIFTVEKLEFQKAFEERKRGSLNQAILKQIDKLLPGYEMLF
ncbi:MAG: nucleotidyltransferase domain-containing protein [archaeon]